MKYIIHTDVEFSRRKRLHHCMDETDTVRWTGTNIYSALEWLAEQGESMCLIKDARGEAQITFSIV